MVGWIVDGAEEIEQIADFTSVVDQRSALEPVRNVPIFQSGQQVSESGSGGHEDGGVGETRVAASFERLVIHLPMRRGDVGDHSR